MITAILIGTGIYVVASYVVVYRWMSKNPGPAGLGMLFVPWAPLLLPIGIGQAISSFFKRIFS